METAAVIFLLFFSVSLLAGWTFSLYVHLVAGMRLIKNYNEKFLGVSCIVLFCFQIFGALVSLALYALGASK